MQYSDVIDHKTKPEQKRSFQLKIKYILISITLTGLIIVLATQTQAVSPEGEVDWLSHLADSGNTGAQLQLGLAYINGQYGLEPDQSAGRYWLKAAAKRGNTYAQQYLADASPETHTTVSDADAGFLPRFWYNIKEDFTASQTAKALLTHARQGDPIAEFQLAMRYRDGSWAVEKNAKQSMYWLQRAAAAGNPVAMQDLTTMHQAAQVRLLHKTPVPDSGGHV